MKHARAEDSAVAVGAKHGQWLDAIRAGERAAVARAITAIENELPVAQTLLAELRSARGRAHVVGITGPPGAGKSTLINALLQEYARRGDRIAVVAVDPSSPISGGAVLGDRIRMVDAGSSTSVFIRSLASRGQAGGLSRTTAGVVDLLDAAGFGTIVVETVGAGQSDVAITGLADTNLVVCPPGLGDDVQAIKAGILEVADILVVSKSDSPLAERTVRDLREMLALRRKREGWKVPVRATSATRGEGIGELVESIAAHAADAGRGRRLRGPDARCGDCASPAEDEASARVRRLAARDPFLRHCAIELVEAALGTATLRMPVGERHLNFNGTCHGGAIFSLADSAFGLASNSHGVVAAGIDAHVTYQAPAREGDTLTAHAVESSRSARIAVYRIDVTRSDGRLIASFTGTVYINGRPNEPTG